MCSTYFFHYLIAEKKKLIGQLNLYKIIVILIEGHLLLHEFNKM